MADRPDPNDAGPWQQSGADRSEAGQPQQPYPGQPYQGPPADPAGWTHTPAGWSAQPQQWDGGQQGWSGEDPGWAQQGYPQGYSPPPQERKSSIGWLIGAGVVAVLALGAGLAFLLWPGSDSVDGASTASGGAARVGAEVPSEAVAAISPCSAPPKMTGTSATQSSDGLSVQATMTAACPGGDVLSNSAFEVAVTAGGSDVAAGSFDLSSQPIVLEKDQSARVTLVFPAGSYWRPADMATGELALTGTLAGASAAVPDRAVQNPSSLTAIGPGTPQGGSADAAALAALDDIMAADAITLRGLQGQWLPQISSKKVGLFADGITWGNEEILREFLENRAQFPESLLLWSGDWGSFDSPGAYWVTVVGSPTSTADSALAWCVRNGLDQEHCLAKIVNERGGSSGTTKHQPR